MRPRSADGKVSDTPMSSAASGPGGLETGWVGAQPRKPARGPQDQRPLLCADAPL